MSYTILFLKAPSPGQVFRYFERNPFYSGIIKSLLLSDSASVTLLRCLFVEEKSGDTTPILDELQSLGGPLSDVFSHQITLLWYRAATPSKLATWGFTVWESREVVETSEFTIEPTSKPGLFHRLPGMRSKISERLDIAWALARDLPIDRVPAAGLRRHISIIDYVTVAQLDQRSLLVENTPRLYRFPLNNS